YNNHDVDDGLRSGLITIEQLSEVQIFAEHLQQVKTHYPKLDGRRLIHETVRRIINAQVIDLCENSNKLIAQVNPQNVDDVRMAPPLIGFSESMKKQQAELKRFLRTKLYQHYRVN